MWIEIVGAPKLLWLKEEDCFYRDGQPCVKETLLRRDPEFAAPPEWLMAPAGSQLRHSIHLMGLMECRSMQAKTEEVLAFYRDRVTDAGLTVSDSLQVIGPSGYTAHLSRRGPGFYAVSDTYHLGIEILEHKSMSFWTIQHHAKHPRPEPDPSRRFPAYKRNAKTRKVATDSEPGVYALKFDDYKLQFISMTPERIELIHEASGEQYFAATQALLDARPIVQKQEHPSRLRTAWTSLPEWVQFDLDPSSQGEIYSNRNENGIEIWSATTSTFFDGCWRCLFKFCLEWLDNQGFDRTGITRPEHSYYVTILQGGASLNLHVQHESGDTVDLTSLNTLGHMSLDIRYKPKPGTAILPGTIGKSSRQQAALLRHSFKHE